MKILITGMSGLLGSNLAFLYGEEHRHDIIGVSRTLCYIPNTKLYQMDLNNLAAFESLIDIERPDVVIHCMAMVNVDACEKSPKDAFRANVYVSQRIANICAVRSIKMVYISTDAVFDGKKSGLYKEADKPNTINVYAETKLQGEYAVLSASPQHLVLRTNIYGFNVLNKYSFGEWILYSLLENKTLTMFIDVIFSPILVNELAQIIEKCLTCQLAGLYHACGSGNISKYEFACELKKQFRIGQGYILPISIDEFPLHAKRSKNMGMSNLCLCNVLEVAISTPIESIACFRELYDSGYAKKLRSFRR